jgi:hypothetical protein
MSSRLQAIVDPNEGEIDYWEWTSINQWILHLSIFQWFARIERMTTASQLWAIYILVLSTLSDSVYLPPSLKVRQHDSTCNLFGAWSLFQRQTEKHLKEKQIYTPYSGSLWTLPLVLTSLNWTRKVTLVSSRGK